MVRWLWFAIALLLIIYAPLELPRHIVRDMFPVYPKGQFIFEIAFIWAGSMLGFTILYILIKRGKHEAPKS